MINGKDYKIWKDGVAIASTRTNNIRHACGEVEYSSPATSQSKEFLPGDKDWVMECSFLVSSAYTPLTALLQVGQIYAVRTGSSTNISVGGNAILKECNITANTGQLLTGTFIFRGTGDLS